MSAGLTATLGAFVAAFPAGGIPARVVERAQVSLIHNLCVGLAGRRRETVAQAMAQRFHPLPAEATLLATGGRAAAEAAALANGALIHARSQDDTQAASTSHPGAPVMAAALAAAEAGGCSGAEFLAAVVLGYEALCRIGRDFDQQASARGYRPAALAGGFGAAAAAARLMRLDAGQTAAALGLAAQQAGGLAQVWVEGSPEGPLQLGLAARAGLTAARLAACGAGAAAQVLEGRAGFYAATAGAAGPVEVLAGLGVDWQLSEVTVKAFPACAILQGPLEVLCAMVARGEVEPQAIEAITLRLNPYEVGYPGIDNPGPYASAVATKMSAQFCLAVAAAEGRMAMADLSRLDDPALLALARKVAVLPDAAVPQRQSHVAVRHRSGRVAEGAQTRPAGMPTLEEVRAFARGMAAEMETGEAEVEALVAAVLGLERAEGVAGLLAACGRIVRGA